MGIEVLLDIEQRLKRRKYLKCQLNQVFIIFSSYLEHTASTSTWQKFRIAIEVIL